MKRILTIAVLLTAIASAQGIVAPVTVADIAGNSTAIQLAASGQARWVQIIADTGNGAAVRCGDSTVSSTRGLPIAAGGGFMFPALPVDSRYATSYHLYNLSAMYCYVTTGDKIYVMYVK